MVHVQGSLNKDLVALNSGPYHEGVKRERRWFGWIVAGIVAIGVLIAFSRPQWIHRVDQVVELDGMHQSDDKWFGAIPYSTVSRDPSISVTKPLLAELSKSLKHPAGVDTTTADIASHTIFPKRGCYLRLNVKGNLKALVAAYKAQLKGATTQTFAGGGLVTEVMGRTSDGKNLTIQLWDSSVKGRPGSPNEGEIAFSWME